MVKKILIIRFSSIGDIVLTSPIVRAIRTQTGAEVCYLTKKQFAPMAVHNPNVSKVFALSEDIRETIAELKAEDFDYVIDLHHNIRTKRIKIALGVKACSFHKLNFEKWLLVHMHINRLPDVHIVDRYFGAAKHLGIEKDEAGLDFFIPDGKEVDVATVFKFQPQKYIAIVIGAAHNTKCLTETQVARLCDALLYPVVLMGGPGEREKAKRILARVQSDDIRSACGDFDILQSASVIRQSIVVITHDTGLMHIAAALRKPQVVIWGNTIPEFGMYPYYGSETVKWESFERKELSCRPCSKIGFDQCPKGHFRCIQELDVEAIAASAMMLREGKA